MKKLPVDVHDFEALITGNHVYVDKTQYIYKMATEGTYYFLSRPRRFGKTLLVSTLEQLFKGNKELFKDLWIENAGWDWTPHPVLKIDFSEISAYSPEVLRKSLIEKLHRLGESMGVEVESELLRNCFSDLIIDIYEKQQRRIAILISEQFIETANAILAAIPYEHIRDQDEHYYHTVFYLMLSASGVLVHTEPLTSIGRIDMEVHFPDKIYIVELKCNQSAEQAITQIKAKKYFEKHLHGARKILLLGLNFSTIERHITEWRVEEVIES